MTPRPLTTYARISDYGFLEAPYRKVDKETGIVTDEVEYMTADVEDNYIIAQANEPLDEQGRFLNRRVIARDRTEIIEVDRDMIDYMDASPKMVVSVATACIPFLENDDNSRALMGSNMQKQAVPLMMTDSPIVATGMEHKAAVDSGAVVCAKEAGVVESVDSDQIVVVTDEGRRDAYHLIKFKRSNQGTCINQRHNHSLGTDGRKHLTDAALGNRHRLARDFSRVKVDAAYSLADSLIKRSDNRLNLGSHRADNAYLYLHIFSPLYRKSFSLPLRIARYLSHSAFAAERSRLR